MKKTLSTAAAVALLLAFCLPAHAQSQLDGRRIKTNTAPLSILSISGASSGQFVQWNGSAYVAVTITPALIGAEPALGNPSTNGYLLSSTTAGVRSWIAPASGTGTVTSVALTMPSDFSVSGSPVTSSGTLAVTAATQSANTVKAGPASGAAAAPTYRALVAADLPVATTSAFGAVKPDGTTITISSGVISAVGASLPTDYISGLVPAYSSATQITVSSGSAYSTAASGTVTVTGTITPTMPSLAASTFYYIYLASSSSVEITTTAPTTYQGTAKQGGTGGNRRYLGCFLTDASIHVVRFLKTGNYIKYVPDGGVSVSPFRVLNGGTSTTATNVSCTAVVPPTTQMITIGAYNSGYNGTTLYNATIGSPDQSSGGEVLAAASAAAASNGYGVVSTTLALNSSRQFFYNFGGPGLTGGGLYVDVLGFFEDR